MEKAVKEPDSFIIFFWTLFLCGKKSQFHPSTVSQAQSWAIQYYSFHFKNILIYNSKLAQCIRIKVHSFFFSLNIVRKPVDNSEFDLRITSKITSDGIQLSFSCSLFWFNSKITYSFNQFLTYNTIHILELELFKEMCVFLKNTWKKFRFRNKIKKFRNINQIEQITRGHFKTKFQAVGMNRIKKHFMRY